MIRTLRLFFLGRVLREKLLLLGFVAIGTLMWASSYSKSFGVFWRAQKATTEDLKYQQVVLDSKAQVDAFVAKTNEKLDPAQTLGGTALFTQVTNLLRAAGISPNVGAGQADTYNGNYTFHYVNVTITKVDHNLIRAFTQSVQKRSPYMSIQSISISLADRNNPTNDLLTARIEISSFEVGSK